MQHRILLSKNKEHQKALEQYNKALKINPKLAEAWNNKGTTLQKLGKYKEALKCYEKVTQLDPEDIEAWYKRGQTLEKL
ncbi:MAG: tetratricopeptide repeat protein [Methanobacteriales archaeon]|nr:tetratricopeptide repeat protein [Methanobacteriales archaeon]